MADNTVIKLASSRPAPTPARSCGNCQHRQAYQHNAYYDKCKAVGMFATTAWQSWCQQGKLWQPIPEPVPVLVRFKRWLIG